jgi:ribosomal protein S14
MVHYLNFRDRKRRQKYKGVETYNHLLHGVFNDSRIAFTTRFILKARSSERLLRLNKYGISHIRGRCQETGRSRFVFRLFGLSRATLRSTLSKGVFSGFTKK